MSAGELIEPSGFQRAITQRPQARDFASDGVPAGLTDSHRNIRTN